VTLGLLNMLQGTEESLARSGSRRGLRSGPCGTLLLSLCLLGACGGSATRDPRGSSPPSVTRGEGGDEPAPVEPTPTGGTTSGGGGGGGGPVSPGGGAPGNAGGSGPAPNGLPLPAGCEPRAREETADTCSLAVYCDTASRLTKCERLSSGRWRCQCDPIHPDRVYHVQGAVGLAACAVAAAACSDGELELGEESCEESTATSPKGDCSTELACGRPIELGVATDAQAWLMRFGSSSCQSGDIDGLLDCQCATETGERPNVAILGGDAACRPLVDFCMSDDSPEYDGGEECFLKSAASDEGCQREESCVLPVRVGDARLGVVEPRAADCLPRAGGGSDCYCYEGLSSFGFRLATAPNDVTCESSIRNCDRDAVIELTGPASCEPTSVDASSPWGCEADLDCARNATVDGREIVAKGRLLVRCGRWDLGSPWWCSCASDQKTTRFQLGAADVEPSEACSQAPTVCIESLPVQFGPYGQFVPPPDPTP
jgi:hypothetical protein